ncbi:MAG: OprO/OprP family phosphate-selective porin [Planctomycetaceae bacterium]
MRPVVTLVLFILQVACPTLDGIAHGDDSATSGTGQPSQSVSAASESAAERSGRAQLDSAPEPPPDAEKLLADLQKRLAALEQKQGTSATAAATAGKDVPLDRWNVKLGGHVQLDYINWAAADPAIGGSPGPQDYFEFRRLRLVADGVGYENCDFRLQMTLEPETVGESQGKATSPDVKDAYFSVNDIPVMGRFRIGNFFVPFGLEQVTNDTNNVFLERSIPTQGIFTPDREVGVALYNNTDDQSISWTTGAFFDGISDTLKERIDDNQGLRLSGRLTWNPVFEDDGSKVLHTGIGLLYTEDQDNSIRFRTRPQIHEGPRLLDSGALQADAYTVGNLELAAVMGPVTLQSEAYLATLHGGQPGSAGGWYAHASWFVTGEHRMYERFGQHGPQFGRNKPARNLSVRSADLAPGAVELKSRYSSLLLDQFDRGAYHDVTTGVNWYWSDRTRLMFDWIHPVTSDHATFGAVTADLLALRFDFNW